MASETAELKQDLFVLSRQRNYMHDQARKTSPIDNLISMRTVMLADKEHAKQDKAYVSIVRGQKTVDWNRLNQQMVNTCCYNHLC